MGVIGKSGAGVLQGHGVGGVRGSEGVPFRDSASEKVFPLLAPRDRLILVNLRLGAPHQNFSLFLTFSIYLYYLFSLEISFD